MDESQKKELLEQENRFFRDIGNRLDQWGKKRATGEQVGVSKATMTRWVNAEAKPNLFRLYKIAELWHLSPAYLLFQEGPTTLSDWNNFARLSTRLVHAKPDARAFIFEALKLPTDLPLPEVKPLRFTAAAVARRLASAAPPTPRTKEDPAHYGRKLDHKDMKRICEIVGAYIENKTPTISSREADDLRYMLVKLQSLVDALPKPPTRDTRADAPNAGGAIETDEPLDLPLAGTQDDEKD